MSGGKWNVTTAERALRDNGACYQHRVPRDSGQALVVTSGTLYLRKYTGGAQRCHTLCCGCGVEETEVPLGMFIVVMRKWQVSLEEKGDTSAPAGILIDIEDYKE